MSGLRFIAAAAAMCGVATSLVAQGATGFSASTELVVLNVRVADRRGAPAAGLTEREFAVFEDGQRKPIQVFASEDAPVTIGLVIDSSISMFQIRDLLIESAVAFAHASNTRDEMFALAFNERSWPALPADAPFTSDPVVLGRALGRVIEPRGRTGLFDAVASALDYAARGTHSRKVLAIVSDGGDNASTATAKDILTRLQSSSVVVYTVALVDPIDREAKPELMRELARATGGDAFRPKTADDIRTALTAIAQDVRHAYTVGFVPSHVDGRYHQVRVTVSPASGRGPLVVKTRNGYLASRETP